MKRRKLWIFTEIRTSIINGRCPAPAMCVQNKNRFERFVMPSMLFDNTIVMRSSDKWKKKQQRNVMHVFKTSLMIRLIFALVFELVPLHSLMRIKKVSVWFSMLSKWRMFFILLFYIWIFYLQKKLNYQNTRFFQDFCYFSFDEKIESLLWFPTVTKDLYKYTQII